METHGGNRMGKIERRTHLNKTTNLEFMEFVRKKAPKDSDSFPKKVIMDFSFIHQNIIPGWHLEGRDPEKRGHFKLTLLEEAFKRAESGQSDKAAQIEEFRKAREAAKAEKKLENEQLRRSRTEKTEKEKKPKKDTQKPKKQPKKSKTEEDLTSGPVLVKTVRCPVCKKQQELFQSIDPSSGEFLTEIFCSDCLRSVSIRTTNRKAGQELAEIEFLEETVDDDFSDSALAGVV
jgi:hypothetical protein